MAGGDWTSYAVGFLHAGILGLVVGLMRAVASHRERQRQLTEAFDQGYEAGRARQRAAEAAGSLVCTTTGMRLPRRDLVISPIANGRGVRITSGLSGAIDDGRGAA